jgi:signal transduction histidine kinase
MARKTPTVADYSEALDAFTYDPGESALKDAYDLGRRALSGGMGIIDVVTIHHRALAGLESRDPRRFGAGGPARRAVERFLIECLSPFEMVQRSFSEANEALRHANEALEKEAKRFAHAVHDEVGPELVSVHFALERLARELPRECAEPISEARTHLNKVEEQLRRISHEFRPMILEDLGLVPALRFLAEGVSIRTGIAIEVQGHEGQRLSPAVETALYRIVQEALLNVGKHAHAKRAKVKLAREGNKVICSVADDGVGFRPSKRPERGRGLGLVGIRERIDSLGGILKVKSEPGRGAELTVTLPLEARNS